MSYRLPEHTRARYGLQASRRKQACDQNGGGHLICICRLKALLLYLYTDKIVFSPLKSQGPPRTDVETPNLSTSWPCSPKSMYRLASKIRVRLDSLRDQAFRAIRSGLGSENIFQELSSSFTSKYPAILQLNVEVLLQHIASVPVIQNIPSLLRRIIDSQLPHGADIVIGLY
ncbi:hypothetical protein EDD22DRAFT_830786 [Suillus occidentalis]|nr:hypothetical protein EDD22DRAFT_830786 [Suillus occidentalis]